MSSSSIQLTEGQWTQIDPTGSVITQITHNNGDSAIVYVESVNQPQDIQHNSAISDITYKNEKIFFTMMKDGEFIWACSINDDANVTVTKGK